MSAPAKIVADDRENAGGVIAELRKHDDWRKIPVVVVSARELTLEDRQRLQGHVMKILQKGELSRDSLMHEVQETVKLYVSEENEPHSSEIASTL